MNISLLFLRLLSVGCLAFFLTGCYDRSQKKEASNQSDSATLKTTQLPVSETATVPSGTIKLFLDNSFSMNGYLPSSQYRQTLTKIVFGATNDFQRLAFKPHVVTDKVYSLPFTSPISFISSIKSGFGPWKQGTIFNSDLIQIFENVLLNTASTDLSILVSDCIYSANTFDIAREGMEGVFKQALQKRTLKTAIYQLESDYSGIYVFPDDSKLQLLNSIKRPYYVWVIGQPTLVDKFIETLKPSTWSSYLNSYLLGYHSTNPFYQVSKLEAWGRYKTPSSATITDVKPLDNKLQFSIAAQLPILLGARYLENPLNYTTSNPLFKVTKVIPLAEYNFPKGEVGKMEETHLHKTSANYLILVESNKLFPDGAYKINLINRVPDWITNSDSKNSAESIHPKKTYGIGALISGVTNAYQVSVPSSLASFTVNIQK